tara:strand:- start:263 stop:457 length:195 start_codon:yes stop_codon:yes gene_type:complete
VSKSVERGAYQRKRVHRRHAGVERGTGDEVEGYDGLKFGGYMARGVTADIFEVNDQSETHDRVL